MNKKILIAAAVLLAVVTFFAVKQVPSKMPEQIDNVLSSEWANSKNDLGKVKSAVIYESVTEGSPIGKERSVDEIVKLLKETKADMIFRGFWRWSPVPESPENIPPELVRIFAEQAKINPEQVPLLAEKSGYNYKALERRISAIKKEIPDIIFVGAIPAQRINRIDKNDITGKVYTADETWAMALDPQKWNIQKNGKPFMKEEFQAQFAGWHGWAESGSYDRNKVEAYYPDITNPEYQELLVSWANRQIDAGADAIWIDGLPQTAVFYLLANGADNRAINDSYEAGKKIIDKIHEYGESKGRRVYVGSWGIPLRFVEGLPYQPENIDFVTMTPVDGEITNKKLGESYEKISRIKAMYPNTPIFSFIDWSVDSSPTVIFSQKLDKKEQSGLLQALDESFAKNGVNFIYPLHGGYMGPSAKMLSFGKYRNYDSLAPEFNTYETIKELAKNKSGGK